VFCFKHINLTGDYVWRANKRVAKGGFRPLRKAQDSLSQMFYRRSLWLNLLYCPFRVLTPVTPDHDVRCTSWGLRSSGLACMLEGCVTVVPRASNSLFTQR